MGSHAHGAAPRLSRLALGVLAVIGVGVPLVAACGKKSGPVPTPERDCQELWTKLEAERKAILPKARPCASAGDCVVVHGAPCNYYCGSEAVPRTWNDPGLPGCARFAADDCVMKLAMPMPSCATPTAACSAGQCVLLPWGASTPP